MHSTRPPLIIAHRGASATAPENTLAAFVQAMELGADGLELDVRLASDGVPVVIHDATLRRTGSVRGAIAQMSSAQLAKADVGNWFNRAQPTLAREEYARQFVPALEDVFQLVIERKPGDFTIYVELKTDGKSLDLAKPVADVIKRYRFHEHVVVVSFELDALRQIKLNDSSIRTGALFAPRHGAGAGLRAERIVAMAIESGAAEILLHRLIARPKFVNSAIGRNLKVVVWTVDAGTWLRRAGELGVHALITNDPALLLSHRH
ncbi:MAG TPA: glycerophosphodiester phosphodiesterase family protein [Pyrinomonadaceae bacterium]